MCWFASAVHTNITFQDDVFFGPQLKRVGSFGGGLELVGQEGAQAVDEPMFREALIFTRMPGLCFIFVVQSGVLGGPSHDVCGITKSKARHEEASIPRCSFILKHIPVTLLSGHQEHGAAWCRKT